MASVAALVCVACIALCFWFGMDTAYDVREVFLYAAVAILVPTGLGAWYLLGKKR